jgi:hypothetical protein
MKRSRNVEISSDQFRSGQVEDCRRSGAVVIVLFRFDSFEVRVVRPIYRSLKPFCKAQVGFKFWFCFVSECALLPSLIRS